MTVAGTAGPRILRVPAEFATRERIAPGERTS